MEQLFPKTGLIRPTTITALAAAWQEAQAKITTAHRLLHESEKALSDAFDGQTVYMRVERDKLSGETPDNVLLCLKQRAWETIIEKMGMKKIMTNARQQETERQLKNPAELPDITELNIMAMIEGSITQISTMAEEMIKEVYEWVRPHVNLERLSYSYKTNIKSDAVGLGEKIIIGWAVERGYGNNSPWRITYSKDDNFTRLDNVFHLLDGKGIVKSHHGPLYDAVAAAGKDGIAETEYFRVKCYGNRNLHLQFKRTDLLAEFNHVAAGGRLRNKPKTPTATQEESHPTLALALV